jgi:hypothetical protein
MLIRLFLDVYVIVYKGRGRIDPVLALLPVRSVLLTVYVKKSPDEERVYIVDT